MPPGLPQTTTQSDSSSLSVAPRASILDDLRGADAAGKDEDDGNDDDDEDTATRVIR